MRRPIQISITLIFMAMLTLPFIARVTFVRPSEVENRALTPWPALVWEDYKKPGKAAEKITPYLRDQLALRDKALTLRTLQSIYLFNDSGYARVLIANDGFMFYDQEISRGCASIDQTDITVEMMAANLAAWADYYHAKGGRMLLVLVPDKAMVYRNRMTEFQRARYDCVYRKNQAFREAAAQVPHLTLIDMTADMLARARAAEAAGEPPVYYKTDTHWKFEHAVDMTRRMVDALQPGLWQQEGIETKVAPQNTDLAQMIGLDIQEDYASFFINRTGITDSNRDGQGQIGRYVVGNGPDEAFFTDPIVVWHDSFSNRTVQLFTTYIKNGALIQPQSRFSDEVIKVVVGSKVFAVEAVMRNTYQLFGLTLTRENLEKVKAAH